ncbi:hypothetical protein VTK56DRAFT_4468 [Thermocarpiscus australiensis]
MCARHQAAPKKETVWLNGCGSRAGEPAYVRIVPGYGYAQTEALVLLPERACRASVGCIPRAGPGDFPDWTLWPARVSAARGFRQGSGAGPSHFPTSTNSTIGASVRRQTIYPAVGVLRTLSGPGYPDVPMACNLERVLHTAGSLPAHLRRCLALFSVSTVRKHGRMGNDGHEMTALALV